MKNRKYNKFIHNILILIFNLNNTCFLISKYKKEKKLTKWRHFWMTYINLKRSQNYRVLIYQLTIDYLETRNSQFWHCPIFKNSPSKQFYLEHPKEIENTFNNKHFICASKITEPQCKFYYEARWKAFCNIQIEFSFIQLFSLISFLNFFKTYLWFKSNVK